MVPPEEGTQDQNFNITDKKETSETSQQSGITPSGSFTVGTMFKAHFGNRQPFIGSSWNIFGVPTFMNKDSNSAHYAYTRRTQSRHHPFWGVHLHNALLLISGWFRRHGERIFFGCKRATLLLMFIIWFPSKPSLSRYYICLFLSLPWLSKSANHYVKVNYSNFQLSVECNPR